MLAFAGCLDCLDCRPRLSGPLGYLLWCFMRHAWLGHGRRDCRIARPYARSTRQRLGHSEASRRPRVYIGVGVHVLPVWLVALTERTIQKRTQIPLRVTA